MLFRRKRREVPGLNTTSTADISFMLLIFFLVTTSMDIDKAMHRQLPPQDKEKHEQRDIDKSKVLSLHLHDDGHLTVDEVEAPMAEAADKQKLRRMVKEFILRQGPSHIIEVRTDRMCDYDTYFTLQNELMRSYREIRDAASKKMFGHAYSQCTEKDKDKIQSFYPQRIQEVY